MSELLGEIVRSATRSVYLGRDADFHLDWETDLGVLCVNVSSGSSVARTRNEKCAHSDLLIETEVESIVGFFLNGVPFSEFLADASVTGRLEFLMAVPAFFLLARQREV